VTNFTQSLTTFATDSGSVSLIRSPTLSLAKSASAITDVFSQDGFLSSGLSSVVTKNSSSLMRDSITLFAYKVNELLFEERTRKRLCSFKRLRYR